MIYPLFSDGSESNCFLVVGAKAAVVDAGSPQSVLWKISELGIGINYLLTTHYHFDHVLGLAELRAKTGAKVAAHEADASFLEAGDNSRILSGLFGVGFNKVPVDWKLKGGESIDLGGLILEVIHTPGHTPGGVCFYEPASKTLFSGDTVFSDGVGRTDFPGGSLSDLKSSVKKLLKLHSEKGIETFYPGHGPTGKGSDLQGIYDEYFG
jgi:hydroxyacylglutathione hydrolase